MAAAPSAYFLVRAIKKNGLLGRTDNLSDEFDSVNRSHFCYAYRVCRGEIGGGHHPTCPAAAGSKNKQILSVRLTVFLSLTAAICVSMPIYTMQSKNNESWSFSELPFQESYEIVLPPTIQSGPICHIFYPTHF